MAPPRKADKKIGVGLRVRESLWRQMHDHCEAQRPKVTVSSVMEFLMEEYLEARNKPEKKSR